MAKGKLKKKVDLLEKALNGKLTDHHRFLLKMHLENIDYIAKQIKKIDEEIQRKMVPFQKESKLIQTIPGISKVNASAILAEIGVDMSQFPDEAHLSSWAGVCPGNNESAGKKKSGKTQKGNSFLKGTLTESAWAASKNKRHLLQCILSQYRQTERQKKSSCCCSASYAHRYLLCPQNRRALSRYRC